MSDQETERLAVLETRLEALPRIEAKLDALYEHYPTRVEMNERIADVRREIDQIRDSSKTSRGLWPVWVAIGITVISEIITVWPRK